jgi:hypothetical protein
MAWLTCEATKVKNDLGYESLFDSRQELPAVEADIYPVLASIDE